MNIPANLQCAFVRHEHPYLMWDGILKIPDAIEDVTKNIDIEKIQKTIQNRKKFYLIGCGTSLFASQIAAYTFQSLSNATAAAIDAFEFSAYPPNDLDESVLVCVSHTGGTPGVYASAKLAKSRNVPVICVTDRTNSKLEELSDLCLLSNMGLEPSLPKTWSFVASLLRLMSIAIASSQADGKDNQSNIQLLRSLGYKNRNGCGISKLKLKLL
jgi:glucosamine--fructose-6-phosphate aminotransferase (isomerizing)